MPQTLPLNNGNIKKDPGPALGAETPGRYPLFGTSLLATSYDGFTRYCQVLAAEPRVSAFEFANTQIVTLRRHSPEFRRITDVYDGFIPDGMPLVWIMNRWGAHLDDQVYGPTFFRHFIQRAGETGSHYLLGGSPECGVRLRAAIRQWNPACQVVGAYHGPCRSDGLLAGDGEAQVLAELDRLSPDYLWVGLGTPKQQAWTFRHKERLRRGVILSVGFAFDVNAGTKPDAPRWMQRQGLTWLFRLVTEPGRLGGRYFKYNSLFLYYLVRDGVFKRGTPAASG